MSTPTILCVDDERNVLLTLRTQLLRHFPSYAIEIAESAVEALELIDELQGNGIEVPLVIADQIMPGMKGDEFLIELHARYPAILKVMLTGQAKAEEVGNVINRGSLFNFLAKPWDEMGLTLTVMEGLRRYRQDQQIADQQQALEQANRQLAALNAELEQQVQERTRQLQRNELQLRLFVEHTPAAVAMFDREMRYLLVSRRWGADYELDGQDLIGRSHYDVFPDLPDHWREIHQRCLAGACERAREEAFVRQDGLVIWVQWEIHPWYTETGEIGGIILFSQVITDRKLAEQALQKSEANLRKAQELAHLGNWEYHFETRQVYWSEEVYRIHGRDLGQPILMGEEAAQYIHPEDRLKYRQAIVERATVGENFVTDLRIVHTNGSIRFIEARGEPLFDANHRLIGLRGTVQDITDRKRTEEALRNSEERLRLALEAAHMGNWDWNIETNQIIWSESLERMMGLQSGEFDGRFETLSAMIYSDDRQRVLEAITRSVEQGEEYDIEFRFIKPDGSIRWAAGKGSVFRDQTGRAIRMAGVDVDITDRKQTEEALRTSEERLRIALEAAQMGSWDWNIETGQLIWSESLERLMGLEPGTFDGRFETATAIIHPDDRQGDLDAITRSVEQGEEYDIEFRFVKPDGSVRWALSKGIVLHDSSGRAVRMVGVDMDITDRKLAEISLRQALISLEQAHQELTHHVENSPLATIRWNQDFRIEGWSKQAEKIFGWKAEEVMGKTMRDWPFIHEEDWHQVAQNSGQLFKGTSLVCQNRNYHKDGSILYCEWYNSVLLDEQGHLVSLLSLTQDVTARKQAELALQQSEAKFQELAAASPAIIFTLVFDAEGQSWFEYLSPAAEEIYEVSVAEILENRALPLDQIHPNDRPMHAQAIARSLETMEPFQDEWRIVTPSGKIKWLNGYARSQRRSTDEVAWYGILIDISDRKQAEVALAQEIDRRKALFNTSIDGIVILDQAGNVIEANSSFAQMLGYSLEEVTTLNLVDFDAHWTTEELGHKIDEQQLCEDRFETRHRRKDGSIYDVEISSNTFSWGDQSVQLCICRDITDRKQAEEALRQSEERWALAIEGSNDGIWDHFLDSDTHFLSPRCLEIIGYTHEEMGSFEKWLSYVHPEDQLLVQNTFQAYLAHQIPTYECEYRMLCKDGNYKWLLARGKAIWDESGTPVRAIGSLTDITMRRQTELALHQLNEELEERVRQRTQELASSEQDLRTIFNNVYDAILIHDMDGTILDANDRALELRGATREQLIGASIADLSAPDAPIASISDHLRRAQAGETLRFEWRERRFSDQSIFDVEVSLRQVTLGNRPVFVAGVRDISDRKRYEAQLQRTNEELIYATRMKDDFLATMSHELRTPLNAILGMTESLQEGIFGALNDRQLKALQTVELSSSHLLELINDILDFTKVESNQMELARMPIAVASLCQASLGLIKQQALKKRIQLELKLPTNLPALYIDERRIRQVLINLLNNAIKFTPEGGRITLEAGYCHEFVDSGASMSSPQDLLRIAVSDTGIGIAPEHLGKLFQPFVQIDSALNRQYEGTGLGLALVKRIVELHGGKVEVMSQVGEGSCFMIDLPCTTSVPTVTQRDIPSTCPNGSQWSVPQANPLILLAEDNEANIITTANYLTAKGYRILMARNGQEAIALAQSDHPDVILMDIQMPGIDGLEAIQQIRQDPDLVNVLIIALTALAMPGDRDRCLTAGANLYLSKPVKLKELNDIIQDILDPELI